MNSDKEINKAIEYLVYAWLRSNGFGRFCSTLKTIVQETESTPEAITRAAADVEPDDYENSPRGILNLTSDLFDDLIEQALRDMKT